MTVYVVSRGENHEGGKVDKIFSSLANARAFCRGKKFLNHAITRWENGTVEIV